MFCAMRKNLFETIIRSVIRSYLNEAFKSNKLRDWFNMHGGVKKVNDYSGDRIRQDGLGDVTDQDIVFMEEFDNSVDAVMSAREKINSKRINAYITVYQANDGYALVVGLNRDTIPMGYTWYGERTKKLANRINRNEMSPSRSKYYVDDSDKYYYSYLGHSYSDDDLGIRTSDDYKKALRRNAREMEGMTPQQRKEFQKDGVERMKKRWRR